MDHLSKKAKLIFSKKFIEAKDPIFPTTTEALDILRDYCEENNIPIGETPTSPVTIIQAYTSPKQ